MKKIVALVITLILGSTVIAQDFNDYLEVSREVLKTEKKALIAELMQFTPEESQVFWPLYNEHQQKKYQINTRRFKVIQQFADNFGNMSEEAASDIINSSISIDMELVKLEKIYAKKFQKILTPQRALRYLQAERKIEKLIDAEIALEVPLLEEIED